MKLMAKEAPPAEFESGGKPCFIIAEAGVNHNGDIEIAKALINSAADAGADAVKFQTFHVDEIVTFKSEKASYQKRANEKTQYQMLKRLELSFDDFIELKQFSDKRGIEFLSTPYDIKSVRFLDGLGQKKFKIASADIVNRPLIEEITKTGKQIILSTGMATLEEIKRTLLLVNSLGGNDVVLLHCTTSYPAPYAHVNMRSMLMLKNTFNMPMGYSDHTVGIEIPIMAVTLGAKIIEKHLTLDRRLEGPDHFASIEPDELKNMVQAIRHVETAFGSSEKKMSPGEKENIFYMRRSIHASRDLKIGDEITEDHINIVRPNEGIEPWSYNNLIGKKVKADIEKGMPITWGDIT